MMMTQLWRDQRMKLADLSSSVSSSSTCFKTCALTCFKTHALTCFTTCALTCFKTCAYVFTCFHVFTHRPLYMRASTCLRLFYYVFLYSAAFTLLLMITLSLSTTSYNLDTRHRSDVWPEIPEADIKRKCIFF